MGSVATEATDVTRFVDDWGVTPSNSVVGMVVMGTNVVVVISPIVVIMDVKGYV